MTHEIEKKRRYLFEAWLDQDGLGFQFDESRNCYKNFTCHMAWRAFNAALDAVEIELPHDLSLSASDNPWQVKEWCADAITGLGLGLRIK